MALTNFTDVDVYLIARSMLVVNPIRQTVMDSERQFPSPRRTLPKTECPTPNSISCEVNGKAPLRIACPKVTQKP